MSKLIVAALALSQALVASNAAATKCLTFSGVSKDKAPTAVSKACAAGQDSCLSNYHPVTKLWQLQCTTAAGCKSGPTGDGTTQVCCATDDCNTVAKAVPVYCNMYGGPVVNQAASPSKTVPTKVDKGAEYCDYTGKKTGRTSEACKMGCAVGTKFCFNNHLPTAGKMTWSGGCVQGPVACTSGTTAEGNKQLCCAATGVPCNTGLTATPTQKAGAMPIGISAMAVGTTALATLLL